MFVCLFRSVSSTQLVFNPVGLDNVAATINVKCKKINEKLVSTYIIANSGDVLNIPWNYIKITVWVNCHKEMT